MDAHTDSRDAGAGSDAPVSPPPVPPAPPIPVTITANARAATRVLSAPSAYPGMEELGSEARAEILFSGRILPLLGWQMGIVGLYGTGLAPGANRLALLDIIGKLELAPAFQLWMGRMPVVSDRASLGAYATNLAWTPLGTFSPSSGSVGLRRGTDQRGTGAVAWGQLGTLTYHLGTYDPETVGPGFLISGRLALTLGGEESGFYRPSSYYGGKGIFSVAMFAQYQRFGSFSALGHDAFKALGFDVYAELGDEVTGVLDWEASFAKFWGDYEPVDYVASSQLAYLLPVEIGPGRFQTVLRGQYGHGVRDEDRLLFDGQLGYVLAGPRARVLGMYQYGKIPAGKVNLVLFGFQVATN